MIATQCYIITGVTKIRGNNYKYISPKTNPIDFDDHNSNKPLDKSQLII